MTQLAHQSPSAQDTIGQNATDRQRQAARPDTSVWVGASAGTGKTKVLTDRILRLLLPSENSPKGTPPHQILCITFTKTGAATMALKLSERISKWATLSSKNLEKELEKLLGSKPTEEQIKAAPKLFPRIVDAPNGLNIMTIHSFCESILRRFPIEAGLPPSFEVMEETQSRSVLESARNIFLQDAIKDIKSEMHARLKRLSVRESDDRFLDLLNALLSKRRMLQKLFTDKNESDLLPQLFDLFELPKESSEKFLSNTANTEIERLRSQLIPLAANLAESGKNDKESGQAISDYLSLNSIVTENDILELHANTYTKTTNAPKKLNKAVQHHTSLFLQLCDILESFKENYIRLQVARSSADLLIVAYHILNAYTELKKQKGVLDFDDQIEMTSDLLQGKLQSGNRDEAYQWILHKLDNGIDHVLVDEAQDTNPDQWEVIRALTDPFTEGKGARENTQRSLFVVGDEKQSIYSFQRADPAIFEDMRKYFSERFEQAQEPWTPVQLNASFRSVPAILEFVDHVYESETDKKGLSYNGEGIHHTSYRAEQSGRVELWPLVSEEKKEDLENWPVPELRDKLNKAASSSAKLLATKIAGTIHHWINSGRQIGATGKLVSAGDILILLRKRSNLQTELVRALKSFNVPVEGLDRMVIEDHIAVQDLLALARFALLPSDNYTLACILKSPFVGWDEDQLMELCFERPDNQSLHEALAKRDDKNSKNIVRWLDDLIYSSDRHTPYQFFARTLAQPCPITSNGNGWSAIDSRIGEEAIDPVETFLSHAQSWSNPQGRGGLQAYIQDVEKNKNEIKREMEEGGGRVRIMTVHGAKGLQAPIVFMADSARHSSGVFSHANPSNQIFWPDKSLPFWGVGGDLKNKLTEDYKAKAKEKAAEEYKRLLYVAMTRAADELYITGHIGDESRLDETCWYVSLENAMKRFEEKSLSDNSSYKFEDGTHAFSMFESNAKETANDIDKPAPNEELPKWINEIPEDEALNNEIIRPSLSGIEEERVLSPLSQYSKPSIDPRFHRGNIIHTALQFLPEIAKDKHESYLQSYLSQKHLELSAGEQKEIEIEVLNILNDAIFAEVFGPKSRAETPITGILDNGQKVSGQIDRLVIDDTRVLIVDFKTNRPPPEREEDVPTIYRKQLSAYKQVMEKIYPEKEILCGLLWTNIPKMMLVKV